MTLYVAAAALGYLLGSIPVALIVARRHGVDLYRTADGNPGAWNALEQLGARKAWPAFVGDGLKGTLAGLAATAIGGGFAVALTAVAAAMIGHAFPVFARFRGGKSVMTFAGGMFVLAPLPAAIALAACVLVSLAARSFALGARVGIFGVVPLQFALDPLSHVAATGALMTIIGLLFLSRRSGPATSGQAAAPTT